MADAISDGRIQAGGCFGLFVTPIVIPIGHFISHSYSQAISPVTHHQNHRIFIYHQNGQIVEFLAERRVLDARTENECLPFLIQVNRAKSSQLIFWDLRNKKKNYLYTNPSFYPLKEKKSSEMVQVHIEFFLQNAYILIRI